MIYRYPSRFHILLHYTPDTRVVQMSTNIMLRPLSTFTDLLQQCMVEGAFSDPSRRPSEGYWDHVSLGLELARLSGRAHDEKYVETQQRNVRDWLAERRVCHSPTLRLLCGIFFDKNNDDRRQQFIRAHRKLNTGRRDPLQHMRFGMQIVKEEDLWEVYAFDEIAYGVADIPRELFHGWWSAYRPGFLCAFRNGKPFAVLGLYPVPRQWAADFRAGTVNEFQLTPEMIKQAARPGEPRLHWYVSGFSWRGKSKGAKKWLPRMLAECWCQWVRNNADCIGRQKMQLVAEGTTPEGQDLLARFGFEPSSDVLPGDGKPRFSSVRTIEEILYTLAHYDVFAEDPFIQKSAEALNVHVRNIMESRLQP